MSIKLVLVRHGESLWNKENRFTGWTDVDLNEKGIEEAHQAGKLLAAEGFTFDVALTSVLKRAIHTLWIILDEMDLVWIPVERTWRLNERHYGDLQGLNKAETAEKFGQDQVKIWRRSYDVPPPPLAVDDPRHPRFDVRYKGKRDPAFLPACESLKLTLDRVLPYWNDAIVPRLLAGQRVLVAAHGNSLRAMVKHLDNISEQEIVELNIPTGIPLVYEVDDNLKVIARHDLGDPAAVKAAAEAVARQAEAKKK